MSVDTKGLVMTKDKNVFQIVNKIETTILDITKESFKDYKHSLPRSQIHSWGEMVTINFNFGEESRTLLYTLAVIVTGKMLGTLTAVK